MDTLRNITMVLLVIGGLNWGLVGFFHFDLVASIFGGTGAVMSRIIYALVGLSAIYQMVRYPWSRSTVSYDQQDRLRKVA